MTFMIYTKAGNNLIATGESFALAGRNNLIYKLWNKRGQPTDTGWHMSADELIQEYTEGNETIQTKAFLIDFHPNVRTRIGIIELLDIYAYTYSGASKTEAGWTNPPNLRP